jgi:5'-phosphate synthase pdxT subunit
MVHRGSSSSRGPSAAPVIGVLALQGSFALHARAVARLGLKIREVRSTGDLDGLSALILPGGESTTMARLARGTGLLDTGLFDALRKRIADGLPAFGTCAGAILLGRGDQRPPRLELIDVEVERNAYGRQIDSFEAEIRIDGLGEPFHAIFIRAPKLHLLRAAGVEVLARHGADPVLVRSGTIWLATFHPELTDDLRIHRWFLESSGIHVPEAVASGDSA